ncbi:hypothetical protein PEL8287_03574 [Roseovarius litorisediminis]|uniref:Uncharacterized protein n=1 Tax=Roseovarius litorisediminis TaxID=1312363 RepID=A0A1Y5TIH2_9RHOB|nr:hypothetical protein [Roseovarius litorisediminis]SLN64695.1 hypothetical protein PEL8287_03574 [Roseovarius litorisediminis]
MEILEATLSFALVMIIFSTIATTLTEALMRIVAMRPRVLVRAIGELLKNDPFFAAHLDRVVEEISKGTEKLDSALQEKLQKLQDELTEKGATVSAQVLQPVVDAVQQKNQAAKQQPAQNLLDALTVNPSLSSRMEDAGGSWPFSILRKSLRFCRGDGANRVDRLSTCAFLHRLAKTEAGEKLATLAEAELGDVLADLSTTYERYIAASNEFFRKRAHAVTLWISFALAFAVNFEAGTVFRHLMDSPETREALLAEATAVVEENQEAVRSLQSLLKQPAVPAVVTPGAASTEATAAEEGGNEPAPAADPEGVDLAQEVQAIRQTLEKLDSEMALPLGYKTSAFWGRQGEQTTCPEGDMICKWQWSSVNWFIQVVLAGFLIGLGGPFWYKFYASMSSLVEVLRALKRPASPEMIQPDGQAAGMPVSAQLAAAIESDDKENLGKVFKTAANTRKLKELGEQSV